jgi:hypothetical protein
MSRMTDVCHQETQQPSSNNSNCRWLLLPGCSKYPLILFAVIPNSQFRLCYLSLRVLCFWENTSDFSGEGIYLMCLHLTGEKRRRAHFAIQGKRWTPLQIRLCGVRCHRGVKEVGNAQPCRRGWMLTALL